MACQSVGRSLSRCRMIAIDCRRSDTTRCGCLQCSRPVHRPPPARAVAVRQEEPTRNCSPLRCSAPHCRAELVMLVLELSPSCTRRQCHQGNSKAGSEPPLISFRHLLHQAGSTQGTIERNRQFVPTARAPLAYIWPVAHALTPVDSFPTPLRVRATSVACNVALL